MYSKNDNYKSLNFKQKTNSCISGSSETFNLLNDNSELRVDIIAQCYSNCSIFGQIKDEYGNTISGAFVKLVKTIYSNNKIEYIEISKCISDNEGFYQFNINPEKDDSAYKIIVSKTHVKTLI